MKKIRTYRKIAKIHQDMVMVREITAKFAGILKDADNLTIGGVLAPENARPGTYGTSSESALKTAGKLLFAEKDRHLKNLAAFQKNLNQDAGRTLG